MHFRCLVLFGVFYFLSVHWSVTVARLKGSCSQIHTGEFIHIRPTTTYSYIPLSQLIIKLLLSGNLTLSKKNPKPQLFRSGSIKAKSYQQFNLLALFLFVIVQHIGNAKNYHLWFLRLNVKMLDSIIVKVYKQCGVQICILLPHSQRLDN